VLILAHSSFLFYRRHDRKSHPICCFRHSSKIEHRFGEFEFHKQRRSIIRRHQVNPGIQQMIPVKWHGVQSPLCKLELCLGQLPDLQVLASIRLETPVDSSIWSVQDCILPQRMTKLTTQEDHGRFAIGVHSGHVGLHHGHAFGSLQLANMLDRQLMLHTGSHLVTTGYPGWQCSPRV
jgi:hypothetical protein